MQHISGSPTNCASDHYYYKEYLFAESSTHCVQQVIKACGEEIKECARFCPYGAPVIELVNRNLWKTLVKVRPTEILREIPSSDKLQSAFRNLSKDELQCFLGIRKMAVKDLTRMFGGTYAQVLLKSEEIGNLHDSRFLVHHALQRTAHVTKMQNQTSRQHARL